MLSKKQLAIFLSKLKTFKKPKLTLEQYPTNSEIAATVLWDAYMKGDIQGKTIADFGAGTGILGIGALLLGAKKVYFVEKDKEATTILKKNLENIEGTWYILNNNITQFEQHVDTVLENPPFGTKQKHADKPFLETAFHVGTVVYSFHKTATDAFVRAISAEHSFSVVETYQFSFPLRQTYFYHKKKRTLIDVTCYRMVRKCTNIGVG